MTARREFAENELLIVRTFDAPPSVVFALWSSPSHLKRWMGPKSFTCPVVELPTKMSGRRSLSKSATWNLTPNFLIVSLLSSMRRGFRSMPTPLAPYFLAA